MVGIIDCDSAGNWCAQQGIEYYPYLRLFNGGDSRDVLYSREDQYPVINALDLMSQLIELLNIHNEPAWNVDEDLEDLVPEDVDEEFEAIRSEL